MNNKIDINKLKPFSRFIMTIGEIPSSYLVSMTYEEQLIWLCNYLEKTVIPAINNNAEAFEELQELFIELKNYVNNYFENLDVQEEINNKLDEMAESGELEEIITAYLNVKSILAYNNKEEMKQATNIVDGSFLKTYGTLSYNDGYGNFYKARQILNTDVIDDINIISLNNPNLVAELIPNATITSIINSISNLENNLQSQINVLNNNSSLDYTIIIGDSYLKNPSDNENWGTYIRDYLNLEHVYINGVGGSCFSGGHYGNLMKFITQLQNVANNLTTEEKNQINNIIVGGGFNDRGVEENTILSYIEEFMNYAKTTFPNARVYLAMMGYTLDRETEDLGFDGGYIYNLRNVLPAYAKCELYGMHFLPGVQYVMHRSNYFNSDLVHPNQLGAKMLATAVINCLKVGSYNVYDFGYFTGFISPSSDIQTTNTSFASLQNDNIEMNILDLDVKFNSSVNLNGGTRYLIGKINTNSSTGYSYGGGARFVGNNSVDCSGLDVTNNILISGNLSVEKYNLYFTPKKTISNTRRIIFYGNIIINAKTNLF